MRPQNIRDGVKRLLRLPLRTRAQIDADADAELEAFIAERVDYFTARGMSPEAARNEALNRLGQSYAATTQLLHQSARTRESRLTMRDIFDDLMHDLKYAFRTLRRDVRFAAFAILIVGLGIGASVTVFSVANALLLRALPFREPERLVWIANSLSEGLSGQTTQVGHLQDLAAQSKSFSDVAAYFAFYTVDNTKVIVSNETIRMTTVPVTQNFFTTLGVIPVLGRNFVDAEVTGTGAKAIMLSYTTWQRRFAGDPQIVGKTVTLNDEPNNVIGVLPATFDFGSVFAPGTRADLFEPFPLIEATNRWGNTMSIIGRLQRGQTLASSASELSVLAARFAAAHPERNNFKPRTNALREHVSGSVRGALVILALAVGVVMLIVCANLSNLLLVRATTRQKEMAVRIALGAARQRLVRQLLTESMVLSVCGALLGAILALMGTRAIAGLSGFDIPLLANVHVDATALGFTALLTVIAGLAFGIAPAMQIPTAAVQSSLKDSGRNSTGGRRGQWVRNTLVVSEVALACTLLVGSGLLARSFLNVLNVNLGFRPHMVASVRVDPGKEYLTSQEKFVSYVDEVIGKSGAVKGVTSVALSDGLPLGTNRSWGVRGAGKVYAKGEYTIALVRMITEGYIGTMGMRLVAGRDFSTHDANKSEPVIVINESMAREMWPGENAVDKMVTLNGNQQRRVVGVVADVRTLAVEKASGNEMYLPLRQTGDFSAILLVLRTTLDPPLLATSIRNALQPIAPNLPTTQYRTLQQIVDHAVSPRRFTTLLLGGFAAFALLLALMGIYGVISYTVNHRTQEIGVRMALGASAGQLQRRIIRETLTLAGAGMVIGTVASWAMARALGTFLYGVSATDPVTFIGMLVVLTVIAIASGYLPARRASRIDPAVALRGT